MSDGKNAIAWLTEKPWRIAAIAAAVIVVMVLTAWLGG